MCVFKQQFNTVGITIHLVMRPLAVSCHLQKEFGCQDSNKAVTRQRQGSDKAATRQPAISLDQVFVYVQSVINQNDWGEAGNIAKRGDLSPSAHSFSSLPTSYVLTCDRLQSKCNIATCWQSVFINYAAIICKPLSATELDRLETTRRTVQPPLQPEVQHPQPLCEQLVAAG